MYLTCVCILSSDRYTEKTEDDGSEIHAARAVLAQVRVTIFCIVGVVGRREGRGAEQGTSKNKYIVRTFDAKFI